MHATAKPAALESALVAAWQRRRPSWTRTDTARWINDRSAAALAWLRRSNCRASPAYSRQVGYWLKEREAEVFSRIHHRLAAMEPRARILAAIEDVT